MREPGPLPSNHEALALPLLPQPNLVHADKNARYPVGAGYLHATDVSWRLGTVLTILGTEGPYKMCLLCLYHHVGYP